MTRASEAEDRQQTCSEAVEKQNAAANSEKLKATNAVAAAETTASGFAADRVKTQMHTESQENSSPPSLNGAGVFADCVSARKQTAADVVAAVETEANQTDSKDLKQASNWQMGFAVAAGDGEVAAVAVAFEPKQPTAEAGPAEQ